MAPANRPGSFEARLLVGGPPSLKESSTLLQCLLDSFEEDSTFLDVALEALGGNDELVQTGSVWPEAVVSSAVPSLLSQLMTDRQGQQNLATHDFAPTALSLFGVVPKSLVKEISVVLDGDHGDETVSLEISRIGGDSYPVTTQEAVRIASLVAQKEGWDFIQRVRCDVSSWSHWRRAIRWISQPSNSAADIDRLSEFFSSETESTSGPALAQTTSSKDHTVGAGDIVPATDGFFGVSPGYFQAEGCEYRF